jgi:1-deoxy-D-xylulose-5-phosphate reductoisomerase
LILLGSTGSIGVNTLELAKKFFLHVEVLVAGRNIALLNKQLKEHNPSHVIVQNKEDVTQVEHKNVSYGMDAILSAIENSNSSLVVNALVGFVGLRPTLKAIECGKKIALANKESLVAGGAFVDTANIQPIDSEHFGLWYLLQDKPHKKMIITASGGAFRDWDISRLKDATLADTQKHPNWSMGQKITIDSATMTNKLFEILEARWLFGEGEYDAIIETKSLIHALIDFKDGSTTAHIAKAHMQLPIAYALDVKIDEAILDSVDLVGIGNLEFRDIDKERYNIWHIKNDILKNPHKGVIVNASNEASIEQFIDGKISFLDISKNILRAYEKFDVKASSIEDIFDIDKEVRAYVKG